MNLFLTSAYPYHPSRNFAVSWLKESAELDTFGKHTISDDPEYADVILFTEHHPPGDPYFFQILGNKLYKKYKHKSILYSDIDRPISILPSILPSIEKKYHKNDFTRSGPYIARHCENTSLVNGSNNLEKKYLFSFIGAVRTHQVRSRILLLNCTESYLKDTSKNNLWDLGPEEKKKFEVEYVNISLKSHFILCPRGEGVNSYRLYEAMQMGLAPVIISDQWVPMSGPDWKQFSVCIPEKDISKIPGILLERKKEAKRMGNLARKNWEMWFSKEVCFHHIASMCEDLLKYKNDSINKKVYAYGQFLRPFHSRNLLRFYKNRFL